MASSAVYPDQSVEVRAPARAEVRPASVPWYVVWGTVAVTSAQIGGVWDVSWHRSIGRDTFWTPAHMAIQACAVIAAVICGYLIFATTFGSSETMKAESVNVLGLRAPLGAFIAAWGGIAMLVSAPFDNWWHAAYGLDVKIVSPPHTVLILGIRAVGIGILFMTLAAMNRAASDGRQQSFLALRRVVLYMGGLMVAGQMFFLIESTWDVELHQVGAYVAMAIALPVVFALMSLVTGYKWACTTTAAIYTAMGIAEILILPLFPAQPKLGPVYVPVTHLIPVKFPILIVVPALALDLLWQRTKAWGWSAWKIAAVSGALFVAVLIAVEWPFATFLLSKASENRFFGTMYFQYNTRPNSLDWLRKFVDPSTGRELAMGLLRAAVFGSVGTWLGLRFGGWMKGVQR